MVFEDGYREIERFIKVQFDPGLVPVFIDAMRKEGSELLYL